MKTSDKLLLTLAFLLLATFGAINLTLYARLKAGHIKNIYSHDGWVRSYQGNAPSRITLQGNINVTLIPSDSFSVEVQEEAAGKVHCRLSQDSMIIYSDDTLPLNPHTYFQNYSDRPWVSVNMPSGVNLVRTEGQLALFRGTSKPERVRFDIQAVNSLVWLGETYGMEGASYLLLRFHIRRGSEQQPGHTSKRSNREAFRPSRRSVGDQRSKRNAWVAPSPIYAGVEDQYQRFYSR